MRARELACQGIGFGAVPAHACPQDRRDNTGLQIHAPNHMILRIGYVKDVARRISESLGPGKFGVERSASIARIALLPRTSHAVQSLGLRVNSINYVALAQRQIEIPVGRRRQGARTFEWRPSNG